MLLANHYDTEPSVILASRVLSACSNPSPPPSPRLSAPRTLPEYEDIQLVDISGTPEPPNALTSMPGSPLIPLDSLAEPDASSSPFVPRVSTPTQQHVDRANTSQPDLIAFDSFSTPNASHLNPLSGSTPSRDHPSQQTPASVDDLLSISPRTSPPTLQVHSTHTTEPPQNESAGTPDEDMEVDSSLIVEVVAPPSSPPLIQMSVADEASPDVGTNTSVTEGPGLNEQTPPLRRSTRPRKSRDSLPQTVVNTSPQPTLPEPHFTAPESSNAEKPEELKSRTQRKRSLKPSPRPEDTGEGASTDAPITPRRLQQVARVQRELGSLSPMSAAALSQLVPTAAAGSASGSSTPLPPPVLADGNVPSVESDLPPDPKTPPKQNPTFVFPQVGLASEPEPGTQRPKSPLRPFSPFKFGEGSRTPARRVPIAQAVAEGTYSPNKLPASFGAAGPTNAPGSPIFKKLALDDPLRSPARRVPMSEAFAVRPPSPGKALDKGKGKAIPRPQSPVRASSVPPRERSTSIEPPPLARGVRGASAEPISRQPALGRRPLFQKPASSDGIPGSAAKSRSALPFSIVQPRSISAIPEGDEGATSPIRPAPTTLNGASARATSAIPLASPAKQGSSLRQPSAGSGSKIPRIGAKPYARPKTEIKADAASKPPVPLKSSLASSKLKVSLPEARSQYFHVDSLTSSCLTTADAGRTYRLKQRKQL